MTRIKRSVILIALLSVVGCAGLPFPRVTLPDKPETVYRWRERARRKPKAVVYDDKVVVVEETDESIQVDLQRTPHRLSLAERLGNWISGLSLIGFVILIACLILAPGATITFLLRLFLKWKRAFRETALAIRESRATDKDQALKKALEKKQSTSTKVIVDKLKRET